MVGLIIVKEEINKKKIYILTLYRYGIIVFNDVNNLELLDY